MILKNLSRLIVRNLHLISNLTDQILPEKPDKNEIRLDDENISCRRKQFNGRRNNSDNLDSKPTRQPKHPLRKKNNAHRPDIDNDLAERLTQKIGKNKAMIHPNKLLNTFCMLSRILSKTIDNCVINTVFNGCSKNASPTGTGTVQNKKRDSAPLPIPQHKNKIILGI